jgi:hypothetical protein
MLEIAILLTFISIAGLVYTVSQAVLNRNQQIKTRLERLKPVLPAYSQIDVRLEQPLPLRLFGPVFEMMAGAVEKLTPQNTRLQAENLLDLAGHPGNLSTNEYLAIKLLVTLAIPGAVYFTGFKSASASLFLNVTAALILALPFAGLRFEAGRNQPAGQDYRSPSRYLGLVDGQRGGWLRV